MAPWLTDLVLVASECALLQRQESEQQSCCLTTPNKAWCNISFIQLSHCLKGSARVNDGRSSRHPAAVGSTPVSTLASKVQQQATHQALNDAHCVLQGRSPVNKSSTPRHIPIPALPVPLPHYLIAASII